MTFDARVYLLLGGEWVDVTCMDKDARVLGRDKITITRGRGDWADRPTPSKCTFSLLNSDGRFSPRNPSSPYYGQLGRNVPVKVEVNGYRRFLGEVAEWPVRGDQGVYVTVVANGVLRRIARDQSQQPIRSALYRELTGWRTAQSPYAYWPCEDDTDTDAPASALSGHPKMKSSGDPLQFASYSDCPGSATIMTVPDGSQVYGDVPSYGATGEQVTVMAIVRLPDGGVAAANTPVVGVTSSGTIRYWQVRANVDGTLSVSWSDGDTLSGASAATSWTIAGAWALVTLTLSQSGTTAQWALAAYREGTLPATTLAGTVASRTFVRVTRITVAPTRALHGAAIGHVAVLPGAMFGNTVVSASSGWNGQPAGLRIQRLCYEERIPFTPAGAPVLSEAMGPQRPKTLLDLLHEAAESDCGFLYEPLNSVYALGQFGSGTTDGWVPAGATTVAVVGSPVYNGVGALRINWAADAGTYVHRPDMPRILIPGIEYKLTAWVYVPAGSPAVRIELGDGTLSAPSTLFNTWQELTVSTVAAGPRATLRIRPASLPGGGAYAVVDEIILWSEAPGIAYRTLSATVNRAAIMTLDFDQKQVAFPFEPTDDDSGLANDITVQRDRASSVRYTVTEGPLSAAVPPEGVGRYPLELSRSVATDADAFQHAAWQAHLGTWDEMRVPRLSVNLRRNPSLIPAAVACDIGSRIVAVNPPDWMPPATVDQIVQGYEENLDVNEWTINFNTTPGGPLYALVLDAVSATLDADTSSLDAAVTAGATSLTVRISPDLTEEVKASAFGQGTSAAANYIILLDADAPPFSVGDAIRLYDSTGELKEDTVFTITAKNSAFGYTNLTYQPSSFAGTYAGDEVRSFYQWSPPGWTTSPADMPIAVELIHPNTTIGEEISVTAVSALTGPNGTQTFTVPAGVSMSWPKGTKVRVATDPFLAYPEE